MPSISMLIKPVSSSCNMGCDYCFYNDVATHREVANYGKMSIQTLEIIIKKAFEHATEVVNFGFQGGEPTLAGLDFFNAVIQLQDKYNVNDLPISNCIQTNGLTMTAEFAEFFHKNNFLVGLSLDGTQNIHDKYRKDKAGNGTFERVMAAVKMMKEHKVDFNILSTVNIDVAKNIDKIYYFFKKQGFKYLQFIPCLDGFSQKQPAQYSLTPTAYGEFLKKLFSLWYVDLNTNDMVSIRYFDNLAVMLKGYAPESCGMCGECACYYMIEADGSVYPCDFYVTDEWKLGNILTDDFGELLQTDRAKKFVEQSKIVDIECKKCEYFSLCRGGCRRNRDFLGNSVLQKNFLCDGFKDFFAYAKDDLQKIADKFLR